MHTLTRCPVFQDERVAFVNQIKQIIDNELGVAVWNDNIKNRDELVRLIIDNSVLFQTKDGRKEQNLVNQLEKLSRNLCYRIHNKKLVKLNEP